MTRSETRSDGGQLILRARLGARLRQLREHAGVDTKQAAAYVGISESTLSRIETGKQSTGVAYVRGWASLYRVPELGDELVDLAERGAAPNWWAEYGAEPWFREMLAREAIASEVCIFEVELIHGLLQTEGYIRGFRNAAIPDPIEEETVRLVNFRLARQEHLADGGMPQLRVVLNEAVLLRPVGDGAAWHGQLERLVEASAHPEVTIQILPFTAGAHPAMGVPFTTITVAEEPNLNAVYLEDDRSGRQLTREADLRRYRGIFERLTSVSWSPEKSVAYISTLARNA